MTVTARRNWTNAGGAVAAATAQRILPESRTGAGHRRRAAGRPHRRATGRRRAGAHKLAGSLVDVRVCRGSASASQIEAMLRDGPINPRVLAREVVTLRAVVTEPAPGSGKQEPARETKILLMSDDTEIATRLRVSAQPRLVAGSGRQGDADAALIAAKAGPVAAILVDLASSGPIPPVRPGPAQLRPRPTRFGPGPARRVGSWCADVRPGRTR